MSKIAVVYWSGTGNTEKMAELVAAGIKDGGGDVTSFQAAEFSSELMDHYDAVAFGCPSMGAEELEEAEFAPLFEQCEKKLKGKKIALFGSYGWGDGEWMRCWEDRCIEDEAVIACPCVICNEAPDETAQQECKALGKSLL